LKLRFTKPKAKTFSALLCDPWTTVRDPLIDNAFPPANRRPDLDPFRKETFRDLSIESPWRKPDL